MAVPAVEEEEEVGTKDSGFGIQDSDSVLSLESRILTPDS